MLVARCRELAAATGGPLDPGARYVLAGSVNRRNGRLTIRGYWGTIEVEGTEEEISEAKALLESFDGQRELGEMSPDLEPLVASAVDAGIIFDSKQAWTWFNEMSANPAPFYGLSDPSDAYTLGQWAHPLLQPQPGDSSRKRRPQRGARSSLLHEPDAVDADSSTRAALAAARASYVPDGEGVRPVPSAGAMYPLHIWVVGGVVGDDDDAPLFYIPIDGAPDLRTACSKGRVHDALSGDPAIDAVLAAGCSVIVVAVDPGRMVAKYGNRGWRYCLIEAGAVMMRAQEHALEEEARLRPFGGFRDELLADALSMPLLPVLTMLVTATSTRPQAQ